MQWLLFAALLTHPGPCVVETIYPGNTWQTKRPESVGMDSGRLRELAKFVGGRGCVVRQGYMVYSWGDLSRKADIASAAKPFYAHFLLRAVQDGKIPSLDQRVAEWEPRLKTINEKLGFKDREITWRHCANQISCYQLTERPGTAYAYNDWQMALFWDSLFQRVYKASFDTVDSRVFAPLLTEPIGCQDQPTMMAFGEKNRPGRVAISVRDFARFGLLYLRQGKWKSEQLLSSELAQMAVVSPVANSIPRAGTVAAEMIPGQRSLGSRSRPDNQTEHFGSYSWTWWINGVDSKGERMFPDAPADLYGAFGHGGPRAIWVIPSLDIVVSYNDARMRTWTNGRDNPTNQAMKLLIASLLPETPASSAAPPACRSSEAKKVFQKWARIEYQFQGPRDIPNPFSLDLQVHFTSPTGRTFRISGFFDGDGNGSQQGDVWKVRFSADEIGDWKYESACSEASLDGLSGEFTVKPNDAAEGFWKWGRLHHPGTAQNKLRYLKFRDGPFWLKAGCDDPENFLGNYKHYNTLAKRKAAIDYLARHRINSLYIMTHNLGGDDKDVWPWLGNSPREAMQNGGSNARFDNAKLEQWRQLFEHMQNRGVVPYIILEDDSAWKGYDHQRYYKEIIARFGYLPALVFNLGEEHNENYRLDEAITLTEQFADLDPYDHPVAIHNVNRPNDDYVDADHLDLTSIQTGSPGTRRGLNNALEHNRLAIDWIDRCLKRKRRVLVVNFDEARPEQDRRCWWSVYLAGGVWESHLLPPYDRPMSAWEPTWIQLGGTRRFMEQVPFWKMNPRNDKVTSGRAFCLANPPHEYVAYLPIGGEIVVQLGRGREYEFAWWDPANGAGGEFQGRGGCSGGAQTFRAPGKGDWAVRIVEKDQLANPNEPN